MGCIFMFVHMAALFWLTVRPLLTACFLSLLLFFLRLIRSQQGVSKSDHVGKQNRDQCDPRGFEDINRKTNVAIESVTEVVVYKSNPVFWAYICLHFGKLASLKVKVCKVWGMYTHYHWITLILWSSGVIFSMIFSKFMDVYSWCTLEIMSHLVSKVTLILKMSCLCVLVILMSCDSEKEYRLFF